MLVLPELQIKTVLENGFRAIANDLDLLDDIFANYPADMRAEVKTYLKEHKVAVALNWPREGATLPMVGIVNAGDQEAAGNDVLGDFLENVADTNDGNLTEYQGLAMNGTYQMPVLSQDPRLTMYLSYIITTLFVLNSGQMQAAGMHNITISQSDLRFDEQVLPEWENSRMVTVTCLHYHAVPVTERLLTNLVVTVTVEIPNAQS